MKIGDESYSNVWAVDFEFTSEPGECPIPICMVGKELSTGKTHRIWQDELQNMSSAPFPTDSDSVLVAYMASAELGCFLSLGWPFPENILDLYVEFRNATNGRHLPCGRGLIGAMAFYGLDCLESSTKDSMRDLAMRGGPYSLAEQCQLVGYCESDVDALCSLLHKMANGIDMPRALLRGRYMSAVARMEFCGTPVDTTVLDLLRQNWDSIQNRLVERIDADYHIFEGRTFKRDLFASWLSRKGIPWPRRESGALALDDKTFRTMSKIYPAIAPIRELRDSLSQMRLSQLPVGKDGRNRCMLSPYASTTGRNQPSSAKYIFGPSVWIRSLIRPDPGYGLAYVDYSQQEFGIAAALSGDTKMQDAYSSGDPYLSFAKQAGAVPETATTRSHEDVREQYKACALAVQYGMGERSLAERIGKPVVEARRLLSKHHDTYRDFWRWSDAAVDVAMLNGSLQTVFGWTIRTSREANSRSLRNFPMQANGAECLRMACIALTEEGIRVCGPVHDAVLIEARLDQLNETVCFAQEILAASSSLVLEGFRLRSDAKLIEHPDRYADPRGDRMWAEIQNVIAEIKCLGHPAHNKPAGERMVT